MHVRVAQIVTATKAEGPGLRMAIWLQGCPLRCPQCCNPEMLSFKGGEEFAVAEIVDQVKAANEEFGIEGITLLGGEPFAHAGGASEIAIQVRQLGLTVMIFSGFVLDDLRDKHDKDIDRLLANTDILVDGPYLKDQPDDSRRWIGSANQQIHFLSDRYQPEDACWQQPDTLEIRMVDGEIAVNGFPAASAVGFWKRPKSK